MSTTIVWIWTALIILFALAGVRRLLARRSRRRESQIELDDAAIGRILSHGSLTTPDDEPLDEAEVARAEEEFWEESWDEPEEYGR